MNESGFFGSGIGPREIGRRGGLAAPVPVLGAELIVNGDMELDANWSSSNAPTINERSATQAFDGAYSRRIVSADGYRGIIQSRFWPSGWLQYQYAARLMSPATRVFFNVAKNDGNQLYEGADTFAADSWGLRILTGLDISAGSNGHIRFRSHNEAAEFFIDAVSAKPLTLSSLFSTRPYASANCDLSVAITRTAGTQAGLCARLDSASSPANFIIAYSDGGGKVKVDKCVAGTYTNVISGAVTYAAGRVLRLVCSGNNVSAYYNGTQVGSTVTVSDAGIVSNTRHGLFSTYAANSFTGYVAA